TTALPETDPAVPTAPSPPAPPSRTISSRISLIASLLNITTGWPKYPTCPASSLNRIGLNELISRRMRLGEYLPCELIMLVQPAQTLQLRCEFVEPLGYWMSGVA